MSVLLLYDIIPTEGHSRRPVRREVSNQWEMGWRVRRGRETGMIDGANKSQRMMGDLLRGMCKSVVGAGVSVMK